MNKYNILENSCKWLTRLIPSPFASCGDQKVLEGSWERVRLIAGRTSAIVQAARKSFFAIGQREKRDENNSGRANKWGGDRLICQRQPSKKNK